MAKLILSKDGIKREIETPFSICCSMDDLDALIRELQKMRGYMSDCSFGWFKVDLSHPCDAPPNTPPQRWTD